MLWRRAPAVDLLSSKVSGDEELARSVLYLASDQSSFVTGPVHMVDAAMSMQVCGIRTLV
ncbi:MAG: hypothetical protein ABI399_01015 [Bauldia sp.]